MPTPRVPVTEPQDADEQLRAVYDTIAGPRGGQVGNVFRAMSASPTTLDVLAGVGAHFRTASTLPAEERELLVLSVAAELRCDYEWTHHMRAAAGLGMDAARVAEELEAPGDPRTRAVLGVARSIARGEELAEDDIAGLRDAVGDAAAVEVVVMSAYYLGLARIIQALDVPLEPWTEPAPYPTGT